MLEYPVLVKPEEVVVMVDAVPVNPDAEAVPIKIEYVIVDAEKQTTRCVMAPAW